MAIYQIQINEKTKAGKQTVDFLRTIPEAVSFRTTTKQAAAAVDPEKHEFYKGLLDSFHDVRLMMEGKKRKKTLDELIDELRNSND